MDASKVKGLKVRPDACSSPVLKYDPDEASDTTRVLITEDEIYIIEAVNDWLFVSVRYRETGSESVYAVAGYIHVTADIEKNFVVEYGES